MSTAENRAAQVLARANLRGWQSEAKAEGLIGYFRRHGSQERLWQAIRRTLRSNQPKELLNFGESRELFEFPSGDVVVDDRALAIRIQRFFNTRRGQLYGPLPVWYREAQSTSAFTCSRSRHSNP